MNEYDDFFVDDDDYDLDYETIEPDDVDFNPSDYME
jgi:hypothetical protein